MFEGIMRGIGDAIKNLRGKGRITEANVQEGLRQVRTALLEADVNFNVANDFIARVKTQAVGQQVMRSLDPSEQIINIIYQELVHLMKGNVEKPEPMFHIAKDRPTILMLCGTSRQGSDPAPGLLQSPFLGFLFDARLPGGSINPYTNVSPGTLSQPHPFGRWYPEHNACILFRRCQWLSSLSVNPDIPCAVGVLVPRTGHSPSSCLKNGPC